MNGTDRTGQSYQDFVAAGVAFGAAGRLEEGLIAGLTLTEHMALVRDKRYRIDWQAAREHMERQIERFDVRGKAGDRLRRSPGGISSGC